MAYRRRQGLQRESVFNQEQTVPPPPLLSGSFSSSSASSLASQAIKASSAYRDPSLSSAYGYSGLSSPLVCNPATSSHLSSAKDQTNHEYISVRSLTESKQGFWGTLARKAKAILDDDDDDSNQPNEKADILTHRMYESENQNQSSYNSGESQHKKENPTLRKGLNAIASSFNHIGGTIGNAFEEGLSIVENRTADIIQETRKLQLRKKFSSDMQSQMRKSHAAGKPASVQTQMHSGSDIQLKASRDVAMAMAAKAKLLLRELKTVKADLAFAKDRCAQLEEENRILRESREKGDNPENDDLIRLQLETLLAEKARLTQENSILARENRFLTEIVEYHQLTMQDVVYLDEGAEEVTEVYHPIKIPTTDATQTVSTSSTLHSSSPPAATVPDSVSSQVDALLNSELPAKFLGK